MADMTPPAGAAAFLDAHGWGGATTLPVAGDASFRRYFRIVEGARRAILMDAPPPHEDPRPFIAVAEWLIERDFAARLRDLHRGIAEARCQLGCERRAHATMPFCIVAWPASLPSPPGANGFCALRRIFFCNCRMP